MENKPKKSTDREYYMFAIKIIGDFGASIAVPVILLVLLGQYLETKYGFAPWGKVAGFILAAITSSRIIYKKAKLYGTEYQNLDK